MEDEMKMNKLFKLLTMVAVLAIVFGLHAPSSYGQEAPSADDTAQADPGPLTVTQCGTACNATKGYDIGGQFVLTEPGGISLQNMALGYQALLSNTTGMDNTAFGYRSLWNNTTGNYNAADGEAALEHNTTGSNNTAVGQGPLVINTTGSNNTASGAGAIYNNTTGNDNTASGFEALNVNTTGIQNTVSGSQALRLSDTGSNNVAIGYGACYNLISGSNVICIGSGAGPAGDISGPATYIAGIYGAPTTGSGNPLVCIDSTGLLGTTNCATNGAPSAQQEVIDLQQQEIQTLQKQNEEFQQRLTRLEALIAKN
jgi:hypothetical protein